MEVFCFQEQRALSQVCSDKDLIEIACKLKNWEILSAHLSINNAEQAELKKNHPGDYKLQKIEALKLWKNKIGHMATYDSLVSIIKGLIGTDFAEDITDLAIESYKGLYPCV